MVDIVRFSGYRLKELPAERLVYRWAALRSEVEKYLPYLQGLITGYYLDDGNLQTPPIELLMSKLQNGEVYFVFSKQHFIGIAAITDIAYGRTAHIEAIALPQYINSFATGKAMGELFTYAFKEYPEGLGLKKLKATVAKPNMKVTKMLVKAGFRPAGILQAEGLYGGYLKI